METRKIGSLSVSVIGLGCNNFEWRIDEKASREVVAAALDSGINFFDTADMYGATKSEEFLGRAIAGRRGDAVVATKFGYWLDEQRRGAKPDYVKRACEDSLRRLGVETIDLYQLHKPDPDTPIADTLGALAELVKAGKVREIGCSNFSVEQLREAEAAAKEGAPRFVSIQNEYSLLHREPERGVLQECERLDMAFLPYFPLANGLLTGKFRKGQPPPGGTRIAEVDRFNKTMTEETLDKVEKLIAFAELRGRTLLDLAFAFLLAQPTVASVIAGASKPEQVKANAATAGWQLSADEVTELNSIAPAPASA